MKKTAQLLIAALAAFSVVSCGDAIEMPKDVTPQIIPVPKPEPEGYSGEVTFTATVQDIGGIEVSLRKDPAMIFDGTKTHRAVNTSEGQVAEFKVSVTDGSKNFVALVPELPGAELTAESVSFEIPSKLSCDSQSNIALVGKTNTTHFGLVPVTSFVSFEVAVEGITEVVFDAYNSNISGEVEVSFANDDIFVTASESKVTLSGNFEAGKTYHFETIATNLAQGYSLVMKAGDKEMSHVYGKEAVTLEPGLELNLGVIKEDNQIFRITHMWLWGGTGPEYDCSKLWDMFAKAGLFDSTDGRGIEAVKDDYLELASDGTFYNWAGVDARHWWMAYAKDQTPNKKKALDMAKLYSVLPKNIGTWAQDGATFTFTAEDGTETTAEYVPAGSYLLPNTTPEKYVTIETQALKFVIKGGVDDWDHAWDDYGVFYRHPRVLFLEFDHLEPGTLVPEESKTTDTVVFEEEPDNPFPDFDLNTLPGNYVVNGDSGLKVLGGSGDDPAFVSPADKSWCFDTETNGNVWKESDNGLVIKVTSAGAEKVTGTINYWAGNDGAFWNYIWHPGKEDEQDMSHVYGRLPKGEKSFEFNIGTFMCTINGNVEAKLLVPGTHHFAEGNRDLEIPEGCIGLDFKIMDMIPATSQRWTDIDRFVNAPIRYIMIFKKQ